MSHDNRYVIMLVGYTHSGKTTFAKKITKGVDNLVVIDNDEIADFINQKYPAAVFSKYNKTKRNFKKPNLKFLISQDIFKFSLCAKINILFASGNLGKDVRLIIKNNAKKHNYKLVTVYFNLPRNVILSRIKGTKKSTTCFRKSKTWYEVLKNQESYAELPPSRGKTNYFEIKNSEDYEKTLLELKKLL